MIFLLYIAGGITLLIHFVMGVQAGFQGFFIVMGSGIGKALIFFALGRILSKQGELESDIIRLDKTAHKVHVGQKKACPYCKKIHDEELSSCPYCGYRE